MKIWIIISIVLAVIPVVLAFSGSSSNYNIYYAIDGMGLAEGSSTNFRLRSSLLYQPVGEFQNTNFKLHLGPYYVQDAVTTTTSTSSTTTTIHITTTIPPRRGGCYGGIPSVRCTFR